MDPEAALRFACSQLVRPCLGESESGDVAVVAELGSGVLLAIVDGSGHGHLARQLALRLESEIRSHAANDVSKLMNRLHEIARGSRGAAAGMAFADTHDQKVPAAEANAVLYKPCTFASGSKRTHKTTVASTFLSAPQRRKLTPLNLVSKKSEFLQSTASTLETRCNVCSCLGPRFRRFCSTLPMPNRKLFGIYPTASAAAIGTPPGGMLTRSQARAATSLHAGFLKAPKASRQPCNEGPATARNYSTRWQLSSSASPTRSILSSRRMRLGRTPAMTAIFYVQLLCDRQTARAGRRMLC